MDSNVKNEKYVVSAENLSYKEVLGMIADGLGKKRPGLKVNKPIAFVARYFFKIKSLISGKPPIITKETAGTAMRIYHYSSEKFIAVSNMKFDGIKETIDDICSIFKKNNFFIK